MYAPFAGCARQQYIVSSTPQFLVVLQSPFDIAMLAMLLAAVCLISTLFWSNPKGNSFLHKADKLLVWTYCAAMMWCAVHCGEGRKLHFTNFALLVVLILVCFLLSDVFFGMNSPGLELLAHLMICFFVMCFTGGHMS